MSSALEFDQPDCRIQALDLCDGTASTSSTSILFLVICRLSRTGMVVVVKEIKINSLWLKILIKLMLHIPPLTYDIHQAVF